MINPLLLQYIKKQLAKGTPKDIIVENLLSNGWPEADIEDAFMLVPPPGESESGPRSLFKSPIFWIIFALAALILIGIAVFLFIYANEMWIFEEGL